MIEDEDKVATTEELTSLLNGCDSQGTHQSIKWLRQSRYSPVY